MFKHTLSLVASATLVASLGAQTLTVDPIVVTATKTEQSLQYVTSNIEIITSNQLEEKHYATVVDALNSLSGISITSNGGIGSTKEVFIRGMDSKRTLVLINGIRYQDPSNTNGANFANLMISDIERIEVLKGAQSGVWGPDASGGVINIITKSAQEGTHSEINLEKGSFSTKRWGGYISHKTDIYDLKLAIDRIMSDSFTTQAPIGKSIKSYENDPYANTTLNISGHLHPTASDMLGFYSTIINAISDYDDFGLPNSSPKSETKSHLYGISYEKRLNANIISAKVNLSDFHRDEIGTTYGVKIFNGQTKQIELSDQYHYSDAAFIIAGITKEQFEADVIQVDTTTGAKEMSSKGIFITNSNTFTNLTLTESLRNDQYSNFNGKTTGKIGAKYSINKDLFTSANYGTAYTAPNLIQIMNPWGTTNNNLKPENTTSYDATIGYKNFTAAYFVSHVTNLIEWYDPTPLNWLNNDPYYTNLHGTSTFKGYEFAYKDSFFDNFVASVSYTYLKNFENERGEELKRRPKEDIKFSLDYYGISKTHLGLNGEYVGTRYNDDNKQGTQTGRYTLLNTVVNYDLKNSIQLYAKIDNITDKYYQTVDGYATSPRVWYVGLKASF